MEKEIYTKLIYESQGLEDFGPTRIEFKESTDEVGVNRMFDMFHALMIGATYSESQFKSGLIGYLEGNYGIYADAIDEDDEIDDYTPSEIED